MVCRDCTPADTKTTKERTKRKGRKRKSPWLCPFGRKRRSFLVVVFYFPGVEPSWQGEKIWKEK